MHPGDNIRALRVREHLTQAELASILSVSKETVCRWETGKSQPRSKMGEKLQNLFALSHDDIFGIENGLAARNDPHHDKMKDVIANEEESRAFPIRSIGADSRKAMQRAAFALAPADIAARHPRSIFVRVSSTDLSKLFPVGSLVLIDSEIKPWNGCVVLALIDKKTAILSRFISGNDTVILSAYSYEAAREDMIFDRRRIHIVGVAVWYQASRDLNGQ